MPIVKSSSDLQRNIGEIYDLCKETKKPVYITKNGEANLVVMDAEAFDEMVDLHEMMYERELRTYHSLIRAKDDAEAGRLTSFEELRREK